jgi:hypothetical protein
MSILQTDKKGPAVYMVHVTPTKFSVRPVVWYDSDKKNVEEGETEMNTSDS